MNLGEIAERLTERFPLAERDALIEVGVEILGCENPMGVLSELCSVSEAETPSVATVRRLACHVCQGVGWLQVKVMRGGLRYTAEKRCPSCWPPAPTRERIQ